MLLRRTEKFKAKHAVVAQLVEHHLAKVDVASSSLVNRSTQAPRFASGLFRCLWVFAVSGSFSFWRCRAGGGLSRGGCLGGLAAGLLWLSDYLTAGLSNDLTVWSSGSQEAVQEKSSKKFWDTKHAGEGVKLLSEPPRSCCEGRKSTPKPSFLRNLKNFLTPKTPETRGSSGHKTVNVRRLSRFQLARLQKDPYSYYSFR